MCAEGMKHAFALRRSSASTQHQATRQLSSIRHVCRGHEAHIRTEEVKRLYSATSYSTAVQHLHCSCTCWTSA